MCVSLPRKPLRERLSSSLRDLVGSGTGFCDARSGAAKNKISTFSLALFFLSSSFSSVFQSFHLSVFRLSLPPSRASYSLDSRSAPSALLSRSLPLEERREPSVRSIVADDRFGDHRRAVNDERPFVESRAWKISFRANIVPGVPPLSLSLSLSLVASFLPVCTETPCDFLSSTSSASNELGSERRAYLYYLPAPLLEVTPRPLGWIGW